MYGRIDSILLHSFNQRLKRGNIADTAAQFSLFFQGDKGPPVLQKVRIRYFDFRFFAIFNIGFQGLARNL
jgi:hypothetical protein